MSEKFNPMDEVRIARAKAINADRELALARAAAEARTVAASKKLKEAKKP